MTPIPRSEWGALPPVGTAPMHPTRRDRIFGHWPAMPGSLSDIQMLQSAQRYHMNTKGWSDIAYSLAVGRDGKIYRLRGINVRGAHTQGENDDSYAILFLLGTEEEPTAEMLAAYPEAIEWLRVNDPLLGEREDIVVMGHLRDDEASTACPGNDLDAILWEYNHARDYHKPDTTNDDESNRASHEHTVAQLYRDLLGREPDDEGLAHWADALQAGLPVGEIRYEFLVVRLAADREVVTTLAERVGVGPASVHVEVIADQTYQRFLDTLVNMRSTK